MSFTEIVKTIAGLIHEINNAESNSQQKKFLATLRSLDREIKKQAKTAKKHLTISIIASSIISFLIGYFLK